MIFILPYNLLLRTLNLRNKSSLNYRSCSPSKKFLVLSVSGRRNPGKRNAFCSYSSGRDYSKQGLFK